MLIDLYYNYRYVGSSVSRSTATFSCIRSRRHIIDIPIDRSYVAKRTYKCTKHQFCFKRSVHPDKRITYLHTSQFESSCKITSRNQLNKEYTNRVIFRMGVCCNELALLYSVTLIAFYRLCLKRNVATGNSTTANVRTALQLARGRYQTAK